MEENTSQHFLQKSYIPLFCREQLQIFLSPPSKSQPSQPLSLQPSFDTEVKASSYFYCTSSRQLTNDQSQTQELFIILNLYSDPHLK